MTYRPDVDGLRAVAVLAVVLFHADVPGFSGGFVGVDVFFVISGYLITSLVEGELKAGTFTFRGFYERRVRRIFPALIALLFACWLAGIVLLMPPDFRELGKSMLATALSVSNYFFWQQAGYFEADSEFKPLLHTWSLAIEEQFYLLLPLVLVLCKKLPPWVRTGLLAVAWGGSLYVSTWLVDDHPEEAFYLLPSRAWELLTGALLALTVGALRAPGWLRESMSLLGMLAIVVPIFSYTKDTPFPGLAALAPTLGTAAVIAAGAPAAPWVARWLASGPVVVIGLASYSIYLWHWPLFAFLRQVSEGESSPATMFAASLAALGLGWASWRWIERPFRRPYRGRWRPLLTGVLAMSAPSLLGAAAVIWDGMPGRLAPTAQRYAAVYDRTKYADVYDRGRCFLDYDQSARNYDVERCATFPSDFARTKVLVIGDSFAAHLVPGLREQSAAQGIEVRQFTATSCRPMAAGSRRCQRIVKRMKEVVRRVRPDVLVVSGYWSRPFERFGKKSFGRRVRKTLKSLRHHSRAVVLVGQSPTFPGVVPYVLASRPWLWNADPAVLRAEDNTRLNATLRAMSRRDVTFFDPYLTGCEGRQCPAASGKEPHHWDQGHLTVAGSNYYAGDLGRTIQSARLQTAPPIADAPPSREQAKARKRKQRAHESTHHERKAKKSKAKRRHKRK